MALQFLFLLTPIGQSQLFSFPTHRPLITLVAGHHRQLGGCGIAPLNPQQMAESRLSRAAGIGTPLRAPRGGGFMTPAAVIRRSADPTRRSAVVESSL